MIQQKQIKHRPQPNKPQINQQGRIRQHPKTLNPINAYMNENLKAWKQRVVAGLPLKRKARPTRPGT